MLTGLKQDLKQGDSFPITLTFAKAGQITATATVGGGRTDMPAMHHDGTGAMGGMSPHMSMPMGGGQPP